MPRFILFFLFMANVKVVPAQATASGDLLVTGDSVFLLVTKEMRENYDTILAYTEESYWWSDHPVYKVIAGKDRNWVAIQIEGRWNKKGQLKINSMVFDIPADAADRLLGKFENSNFWSLKSNDTVSVSRLVDGTFFRFGLITRSGTKIVEMYEPDLSHSPVIRQFLAVREHFVQLWDQKSAGTQ
jgi:hypothetical protein